MSVIANRPSEVRRQKRMARWGLPCPLCYGVVDGPANEPLQRIGYAGR